MKWLMVVLGLFLLAVLWSASSVPDEAKMTSPSVELSLGVAMGLPIEWQVVLKPPLERPQPPEPSWQTSRRRRRWVVVKRRRRCRKRRQGQASSNEEVTQRLPPLREETVTSAQVVEETSAGLETFPQDKRMTSLETWAAQELGAIELGDARLERRARILVEQFAERPRASIPQACGTWAATKAAYRFFDNPKVSHRAILEGHRRACLDRIADEELTLVLQDTTSLDYTHHPQTGGLGPLENPKCQGMFVHSSLAASDAGIPLGLLDQQVWARDPEAVGQRHQRRERPIEEKESFKWLQGLRASLKDLPGQVCVVTVADREADIFDFFLEAQAQQTQVLVRAAWNRRLSEPPGYLWDEVARTPVRGTFTVEVGRAKDRLPRQATMMVRFTVVTVRPPRHRFQEPGLHPLALYAIDVREKDPPPGEKALHWLLLTNRRVESFEEARRCVRWYGLRWLVERYHFVLKSGCQIEKRQLGTGERLERCLGIYAIVAWRLLWLTYQARLTPQSPCTVALETHEWQALYCYIHKTSTPPAEPPSLNQAVRWIAQLGGFLGRTSDGEPGVKVLWRGWQRLEDIAQTWRIAHPPPHVGNA